MALMAVAKNVQVSAIFHSGILRAKQTAEILAEHLQFNLGVEQLSGLLPQDDPAVAKGSLKPWPVPSFWWAIFLTSTG